MVDRALVAAKVAAVRDAVARIRSVLPTKEVFLADLASCDVLARKVGNG